MTKKTHNPRLIARLDIKAPNLIKGVQLEGLRKIGNPNIFAQQYYNDGIDEIIAMDIVASLYNRNSLFDIVRSATQSVFVPITIGGGLRSLSDARSALQSGADKIAINTAAVADKQLISEIAGAFGSQCVVVSVEAKRKPSGGWEAFTDNGREHTGLDVVNWVKEVEALGAGEILLTSVDKEGTRKGFDYELISAVANVCAIPIIASGGCGSPDDIVKAVQSGADAVAIADILHYNRYNINECKIYANKILAQNNQQFRF